MYQILRYVLIATVLLVAYLAGLVIYLVPYAWLVVLAIAAFLLCRRTYRYTAYGTARWADATDIPHMLEGSGVIVGHIEGKPDKLDGALALFDRAIPAKAACQKFLMAFQRKAATFLVRLTRAIHCIIVAPVGVGKSTGVAIPFLRTCNESAVVTDLKGELYKITANARRKMGQKVVILDPFRIVTQEPDTFNPLQFIDRESPTALDECRDLAEALVVKTGQEREPHWNESAEIWIASLSGAVTAFAEAGDKSLQAVRTVLADPKRMQAVIKMMRESTLWEGMLARLGHQLGHYVDRELGSVLTSANRHLRFLDTLAVAESTKQSSFDPADLLTGKMTIYLVMPPEHMRAQAGLLRLWIGSMLRAVVKGGLQETTKVHFVLDEAAALGHMEALDDAVDKYRGYGVRLQLYYQSLGQLQKCWPTDGGHTLLSNTTQVFFGVNDPQTAEYVSNRLGEETIIVESGGTGHSTTHQSGQQHGGYSSNTSSNHNWQQQGRKLLKPEEVIGLPERVAITFAPGVPPIWTWLTRYYEKGFGLPCGLSPAKMLFDTACLFAAAAMLAAWWTAALFYHTFR
jgi:type IV secretion system protein VirD4